VEEKKPRTQKVLKKISLATLDGNTAKPVCVEASFTKGLPAFNIVGLASESIKESKERVKSALLFNDFKFPPLRITINLAPSDLKKNGSHFDLAIALLIALNNENILFNDFIILGELGLDGSVKETALLFPLLLSLASQQKNLKCIIPHASVEILSQIPGVNLYPVNSLEESILLFKSGNFKPYKNRAFEFNKIHFDQAYFYQKSFDLDFSEVYGQKMAKRAALIAACGMHNILLNGSPGCGKSMIIKRLQYLMPPLSHQEILEKAQLESLDGNSVNFTPMRSFRQPHHSATKASIFGGGSTKSRIGEVALAHNGLLFFDELPHFSKSVLEALREPLEDYSIMISRVNSKIKYEAKFLFASAMNPCPCGNMLSQSRECRCSDSEVSRYKNRLSEPFLDRIDLYIEMQEYQVLKYDSQNDMSSNDMFGLMLKAFSAQRKRAQKNLNGKLDEREINYYCSLSPELEEVLKNALNRFNLSLRAANKVKKVARTIADIEDSDSIEKAHLIEALAYRYRS
jgi:magnesium chelatase family protein